MLKPLADFLEARNAALYALRDYDQHRRSAGLKSAGKDRRFLEQTLRDMGCVPWEWGEDPWLK